MPQAVIVRGHLVNSRTVELEKPIDPKEQVAELLVQLAEGPGPKLSVAEFLAQLPPGTRSKEEIDAELQAERDAW